MTSTIAAEIRALPADLQLAAALAVIEDLTGSENPGQQYLIETMGLSVGMARVVWALHRASPRILSRQQLAIVVWGHDDGGDDRSIDAYVKRIRQRTRIAIRTTSGVGYSLDDPLNIPTRSMADVIGVRPRPSALETLLAYFDSKPTSDRAENDRPHPQPVRGAQQRNRRGCDGDDRGIHRARDVSRG